METLLLTWTIAPDEKILKQWYNSTSLIPEKRYFEYIDTIIYYIINSKFTKIIFCENSNYYFKDLESIKSLCKIYNKNFELLQFNWDNSKTLELWYWYWDAECMDYAFDNSNMLKNSKNWYKISWRYKVININKMLDYYKKNDNVIYKSTPLWFFLIMTWFIKLNNNYYKKYFYGIKNKCNRNKMLEVLFWEQIKNEKTYKYMWMYPKLSHISYFKYMKFVIRAKLNYMWINYIFIILRKILIFTNIIKY